MAKLLVVEDDQNQRILFEQELEDAGYKVVTADDGKEALKKVESEKPDLVIMDINMPGMDGIEALGKILAENNRIPVIFHSAYSSYKDNFMSWAADAYIVKSSDLDELKETIKTILEKRESEK